ncbi:MAG TPA: proton-conducting transporter membrane subunit [Blastocatellia bacterium]|nr:proton-conducting transporter membrane subunit [Blastocatellia bacterium]
MLFVALLVPPLLAAALAGAVRRYRSFVGRTGVALAVVSLVAAVGLARTIVEGGDPPTFGPGEMLRADALSAVASLLVAFATVVVLALGPGLGSAREYSRAKLRRYHIFMNLFSAVMLFAVTTNNVGFMWVAIEATTIVSALLIPLSLTKGSVEASWKYVLIGSVGIAIAFLGTVIAYFGYATLVGHEAHALNWTVLVASASKLKPEVLRFSFALILVGYGTKAGLAPMHTWKPDAYGEAPAPLASLMSSALFVVAMYAIIRWKVVVDTASSDGFSDALVLGLGVLSLGLGALSVVIQRNYKRMLAYSSVEHAGLICIGLALGPLGAFAAILHLVNHTAAKSVMFLLAGDIERACGSPRIDDVRGLLRTMPWTGGLFAAVMLALLGSPPFGIFISELALFRACFVTGSYVVLAVTLVLLTVAFIAFIVHLNRMLYGSPATLDVAGDSPYWRIGVYLAVVAGLVILGISLPGPAMTLIKKTVEIIAV